MLHRRNQHNQQTSNVPRRPVEAIPLPLPSHVSPSAILDAIIVQSSPMATQAILPSMALPIQCYSLPIPALIPSQSVHQATILTQVSPLRIDGSLPIPALIPSQSVHQATILTQVSPLRIDGNGRIHHAPLLSAVSPAIIAASLAAPAPAQVNAPPVVIPPQDQATVLSPASPSISPAIDSTPTPATSIPPQSPHPSSFSPPGFACTFELQCFTTFDNPLYRCTNVSMNAQCSFCQALKFPGEVPSLCCRQEASTNLKQFLPRRPPEQVWRLFNGTHPLSNFFKENIRHFNQALSFATFVKEKNNDNRHNDRTPSSSGPPVIRIHGQVYHVMGSLLPAEGTEAVHCQVYFHDSSDACINRLNAVSLNRNGPALEIMQLLHNHILHCSAHYNSFKTLIERHINIPEYRIVLHADHVPLAAHERTYNNPSATEVAVLIPGNSDETGRIAYRDFVVESRGGRPIRMNVENR
jgi:hypothetical protein